MTDQQGSWGAGGPAPGRSQPTVPVGQGPPGPVEGGRRGPGAWNPVSVVAVGGVLVLVVIVVVLAVSLVSGGDDPDPARAVAAGAGDDTTTASTTTVPITSGPDAPSAPATVAPAPSTPTTAAPAGDGLPSGLFCRDLVDRGVGYAGAVDYWFAEGSPDRMDADLNGIPCETVYPASDVTAYWGPTGGGGAGGGLPSGLFCRDLVDRGVGYAGAVDYWFAEGSPDRMDADLNGIPCETVYPASEVTAFWD